MTIDYRVLQTLPQQGPFAVVSAHKLNQSWNTLQEALDELDPQGWDLCTTIDSPTRETGGPGEHSCEGLMLKRTS
jgi:hypothetical protein